jgi:hypothetical protein
MPVYGCKIQGWMSEKECKDCFNNYKCKQYGHVKHCRRDNVTEIENNNERDYE